MLRIHRDGVDHWWVEDAEVPIQWYPLIEEYHTIYCIYQLEMIGRVNLDALKFSKSFFLQRALSWMSDNNNGWQQMG